jgi:serine/threonine protein kinase
VSINKTEQKIINMFNINKMSLYDKLTFKILPKRSASPTIIILNKDKNLIYKCWNANTFTKETEGLEYEKLVYMEKINALLLKYPDLPFLKYIGEAKVSIKDLATDLGIDESLPILASAIMLFLDDEDRQNTFSSENLQRFARAKIRYLTREIIDSVTLKMIILPRIEFRTLSDILPIASTNKIIDIIRKIVEGLEVLYRYGVVHNDLHSSNIMIEDKTEKVLIFDWDRAYVKGVDNPQLSNEQCDGLCAYGQCNILNPDGYSIDFFKVLCYILKIRSKIGDAVTILTSISKIQDTMTAGVVINFMKNNNDCFFKTRGCTYLQFPDSTMEFVKEQFGSITAIQKRIISNFGKNDEIKIMTGPVKLGFNSKKYKKEKKHTEELKRMIKLGKGNEYIKNKQNYLHTEFPLQNIIVHQTDKDPKLRSLDDFLS